MAEGYNTHPIVVFGADLEDYGMKIGPETRRRCDRAARIYQELAWAQRYETDNPYIVLPSGWVDLRNRYPCQQESMAQMMADYLQENHGIPASACIVGPAERGLRRQLRAGVLASLWNGAPFHLRLVASGIDLWYLRWLSLSVQQGLRCSFILSFSFVRA